MYIYICIYIYSTRCIGRSRGLESRKAHKLNVVSNGDVMQTVCRGDIWDIGGYTDRRWHTGGR